MCFILNNAINVLNFSLALSNFNLIKLIPLMTSSNLVYEKIVYPIDHYSSCQNSLLNCTIENKFSTKYHISYCRSKVYMHV